MATTPPDQPQAGTGPGAPTTAGPGYRSPVSFNVPARLPIPGNAEFVYVVVAALIIALLAWVADGIRDTDWLDWVKWISAAYLISRGIAKASRVLEQ